MKNPREYRSKKRESQVHVKIRLAKRGAKPTDDEMQDALEFLIEHGHAPQGWEFYIVNWKHPKSEGSGDVGDLQAFAGLIREMRGEILFGVPRRIQ